MKIFEMAFYISMSPVAWDEEIHIEKMCPHGHPAGHNVPHHRLYWGPSAAMKRAVKDAHRAGFTDFNVIRDGHLVKTILEKARKRFVPPHRDVTPGTVVDIQKVRRRRIALVQRNKFDYGAIYVPKNIEVGQHLPAGDHETVPYFVLHHKNRITLLIPGYGYPGAPYFPYEVERREIMIGGKPLVIIREVIDGEVFFRLWRDGKTYNSPAAAWDIFPGLKRRGVCIFERFFGGGANIPVIEYPQNEGYVVHELPTTKGKMQDTSMDEFIDVLWRRIKIVGLW